MNLFPKLPRAFSGKTGYRQHLLCDHPVTRQGILNWLERVRLGVPLGSVDWQIIKGQIFLGRKTAEYIYSDLTPLTTHYQKGSRPYFEKVLEKLSLGRLSPLEKFFAILFRCRDNWKFDKGAVKPDGLIEEDILRSGDVVCHRISRVFVVLCQMAGIPARIISAHIRGHMMAEAWVDGKWCWCDPRYGAYFLLKNGKPASFWELIQNPSIVDRQDRSVWREFSPQGYLENYATAETFREPLSSLYQEVMHYTLHRLEAFAVGNYFAWDVKKFNFGRKGKMTPAKIIARERILRREHQMRVELGYPPGYWFPMAWNQPLKLKSGTRKVRASSKI